MNTIVSDTSPLIFLAKLNLLDLLCQQFKVLIPEGVLLEATFHKDFPDVKVIQELVNNKTIGVKKVAPTGAVLLQKEWGLGKGEAGVILLARSKRSTIITDDYSAMRVAKLFHCPFITTPIMIAEMCHHKRLSLELALAKLDALKDYAWISAEILEDVKKSLFKEGGK